MEEVFLSLGSNLDDKSDNLEQALLLISSRIGTIRKVSSIFTSDSWGFEGQSFENLVAIVQTDLSPNLVLDNILNIEKEMGRTRSQKGYENRLIDIDIIYFGDSIIKNENLVVPHPQMHKRNFVLQPLQEIAPNKIHPLLLQSSTELLEKSSDKVKVKWLK